ncbi:L-2-amino-thiazoline-4-carboxylic acid hydrolase [Nisaea sediminum]|uniref:L-2-amino-thiazoline-4-carboxylic acid hydrolase n=1 Tax=Nisaea sediminum TaxID=2775867 RepID=UPI001866D463|nr:L-2-amino-thiazoline-4-carboxylic acid hydrolase [Nisaea sediminum]
MTDLPILELRRIEANVIKPIYEEMVAEVGKAAAQKILGNAIRKAAIAQARTFAERDGPDRGMRSFQALYSLWTHGGALETEEIERTEETFHFNVTRCRYAEMYREMGLGEIGHLLSCNRDGSFCEGYSDRITMERGQTIMSGASHCDFRYRYEE